MSRLKKVLSLLLVLCMVFSMLPTFAFAAGNRASYTTAAGETTEYATFAAAVAAAHTANDGGTVKLLQSFTKDSAEAAVSINGNKWSTYLKVTKNLNVDLNGFTITCANSIFQTTAAVTLNIVGNGGSLITTGTGSAVRPPVLTYCTTGGDTINISDTTIVQQNAHTGYAALHVGYANSTMNLDGCTVVAPSAKCLYNIGNKASALNATDTKFVSTGTGDTYFLNTTAGTVTLEGACEFYSATAGLTGAELEGKTPDGYEVASDVNFSGEVAGNAISGGSKYSYALPAPPAPVDAVARYTPLEGEVQDCETFYEAFLLANENGGTIDLLKDVAKTDEAEVTAGWTATYLKVDKDMTVNLNGHTLSSELSIFQVTGANVSLTINGDGGALIATGEGTSARPPILTTGVGSSITVDQAVLVMSDVYSTYSTVYSSASGATTITLTDSTVVAPSAASLFNGGGKELTLNATNTKFVSNGTADTYMIDADAGMANFDGCEFYSATTGLTNANFANGSNYTPTTSSHKVVVSAVEAYPVMVGEVDYGFTATAELPGTKAVLEFDLTKAVASYQAAGSETVEYFTSLLGAVTASNNGEGGGTINLLGNVARTAENNTEWTTTYLDVTKSVTINLNGYQIHSNVAGIRINGENVSLTIDGGTDVDGNKGAIIANGGARSAVYINKTGAAVTLDSLILWSDATAYGTLHEVSGLASASVINATDCVVVSKSAANIYNLQGTLNAQDCHFVSTSAEDTYFVRATGTMVNFVDCEFYSATTTLTADAFANGTNYTPTEETHVISVTDSSYALTLGGEDLGFTTTGKKAVFTVNMENVVATYTPAGETTPTGYYTTLNDAVVAANTAGGGTVTLHKNHTSEGTGSGNYEIRFTASMTLDLNGYTYINTTQNGPNLNAAGIQVTIKNGNLIATGSGKSAISFAGTTTGNSAVLTLTNVKAISTNGGYALLGGGSANTVNATGCTFVGISALNIYNPNAKAMVINATDCDFVSTGAEDTYFITATYGSVNLLGNCEFFSATTTEITALANGEHITPAEGYMLTTSEASYSLVINEIQYGFTTTGTKGIWERDLSQFKALFTAPDGTETYCATLKDALALANTAGGTIKMLNNEAFETDTNYDLNLDTAGITVTLDLNGKVFSSSKHGIRLRADSITLNVVDNSVGGGGAIVAGGYGVCSNASGTKAKFNLNGVTIISTNTLSSKSIWTGGANNTVTATNCKIVAKEAAILIAPVGTTTFTATGCTFVSQGTADTYFIPATLGTATYENCEFYSATASLETFASGEKFAISPEGYGAVMYAQAGYELIVNGTNYGFAGTGTKAVFESTVSNVAATWTAANGQGEAIEFASLAAAVEYANSHEGGIVNLLADVARTEADNTEWTTTYLDVTVSMTLNLNGNTISSNLAGVRVNVADVTLTINGADGEGNKGSIVAVRYGVCAGANGEDATLILNDVNVVSTNASYNALWTGAQGVTVNATDCVFVAATAEKIYNPGGKRTVALNADSCDFVSVGTADTYFITATYGEPVFTDCNFYSASSSVAQFANGNKSKFSATHALTTTASDYALSIDGTEYGFTGGVKAVLTPVIDKVASCVLADGTATFHDTVYAAFLAANAGEDSVLTLLADANKTATDGDAETAAGWTTYMNITNDMLVDLNGHAINSNMSVFRLNAANIVVTIKDGALIAVGGDRPTLVINKDGCSLTLNDVTAISDTTSYAVLRDNYAGTIKATDCVLISISGAEYLINATGTITANNCKFVSGGAEDSFMVPNQGTLNLDSSCEFYSASSDISSVGEGSNLVYDAKTLGFRASANDTGYSCNINGTEYGFAGGTKAVFATVLLEEGGAATLVLNEDATVYRYATLTDAMNVALYYGNGSLQLLGDVTMDGITETGNHLSSSRKHWFSMKEGTYTVDLNGFTLSGGSDNDNTMFMCFDEAVNLTLTSTAQQKGTVTVAGTRGIITYGSSATTPEMGHTNVSFNVSNVVLKGEGANVPMFMTFSQGLDEAGNIDASQFTMNFTNVDFYTIGKIGRVRSSSGGTDGYVTLNFQDCNLNVLSNNEPLEVTDNTVVNLKGGNTAYVSTSVERWTNDHENVLKKTGTNTLNHTYIGRAGLTPLTAITEINAPGQKVVIYAETALTGNASVVADTLEVGTYGTITGDYTLDLNGVTNVDVLGKVTCSVSDAGVTNMRVRGGAQYDGLAIPASGSTLYTVVNASALGENATQMNLSLLSDIRVNLTTVGSYWKNATAELAYICGDGSVQSAPGVTEGENITMSFAAAAKEMTQDIVVSIYGRNAEGQYVLVRFADSLSIVDYAAEVANLTDGNSALDVAIAAMLNYGAEAQKYFGFDAENLASAAVGESLLNTVNALEVAPATPVTTTSEGDIYIGVSCVLNADLTMKFYFNIDEADLAKYTFWVGDVQITDVGTTDDGSYSFARVKVNPAEYGEAVTITVKNAKGNAICTVTDSVYNYVQRLTTADAVADAMLKYGVAFKAYFASV